MRIKLHPQRFKCKTSSSDASFVLLNVEILFECILVEKDEQVSQTHTWVLQRNQKIKNHFLILILARYVQ